MKTIRISRQGFSYDGMFSWMRYFIFVLTKKYNVIIDNENPDLIFFSNLSIRENCEDTFLGKVPTIFQPTTHKDKKFIFVSGERADFISPLSLDNVWSIGYGNSNHPKFLKQPSGVIDVWTLFDESRLTDSPLNWLTEKRDFNKIKQRNKGFCSITQASHNDFREKVFNKLNEYKTVTSSGPWKQNIDPKEGLNRFQWKNKIYQGRIDGLTFREKIEFFNKYKFNIAIHYTNTDYILQEKIFHSFFSGAIPIFYGNKFINEEGFNPNSFINLHEYNNLDDFLDLVKEIDNDDLLYKKYIEEPIFLNNKLPEYYDFDYTLEFIDKVIES